MHGPGFLPNLAAVPGKSVPFSIEQDGYVRIRLEDGTLLRARPVIVDVRSTGEQAEGEPVYLVQSFVHVVVEERATKSEGNDNG